MNSQQEVNNFLLKLKNSTLDERYYRLNGVGVFDVNGKFKGIMTAEQFFKEQKVINYQSFLNQCSNAKGVFSYYNSGKGIYLFVGINKQKSLIEKNKLIKLIKTLPKINQMFLQASLKLFLEKMNNISKEFQVSFINTNLINSSVNNFFDLIKQTDKKIGYITLFYPYQFKFRKVKLSEVDLSKYKIKNNQIFNVCKEYNDNLNVILVPRIRMDDALIRIYRLLDFNKLKQKVTQLPLYAKFYDLDNHKYCNYLLTSQLKNNIYNHLAKRELKLITQVVKMILKQSPYLSLSNEDFKFNKSEINDNKFKIMFVNENDNIHCYLANNLFAVFGFTADYKQSPTLINNQFYLSSVLHRTKNSKRKLYVSEINQKKIIFLQNNELNNTKIKLLKNKILNAIKNNQFNYLSKKDEIKC